MISTTVFFGLAFILTATEICAFSYTDLYNNLYGWNTKNVRDLSQRAKDFFIREHNRVRRNVKPTAAGMQMMTWDNDLQKQAEKLGCTWGNQLRTLTLFYDAYIMSAYQSSNMDYGSYYYPDDAFKLWIEDAKYYNYNTGKCAPGKNCTYYSQIISEQTQRVGCAAIDCGNSVLGLNTPYLFNGIVHCIYSPSGVKEGHKAYVQGKSCSDCFSWQNCVNKLCTDKPIKEALKWNSNGRPDEQVNLTISQYQEIVSKHNKIRSNVAPSASDMMLMTWDEEFAQFASDSTYNCDWGDDLPDFTHSVFGKNWGRMSNIRLTYTPTGNYLGEMVDEWERSKKYYDAKLHKCTDGDCGSYKQIISSQSYKIGCGTSKCSNINYKGTLQYSSTVTRCYYGWKGNTTNGEQPYTVGESCSNCPMDANNCFNGLCTNFTDQQAQFWFNSGNRVTFHVLTLMFSLATYMFCV